MDYKCKKKSTVDQCLKYSKLVIEKSVIKIFQLEMSTNRLLLLFLTHLDLYGYKLIIMKYVTVSSVVMDRDIIEDEVD